MSENKVWAITRKELDNSGFEVMDMCYEDYNTAYHVFERLTNSNSSKDYQLVELGIVRGALT